jgi:hypothetical protein
VRFFEEMHMKLDQDDYQEPATPPASQFSASSLPAPLSATRGESAHARRGIGDWVSLLLLPVIVLGGLAWLGVLGMQQNQASARLLQAQRDQQAATVRAAVEQREEAILQEYLGRIADLMAHDKLLHSAPIDDSRTVAQALTLTTLRQVGPARRGLLVRFLFETKLINNDYKVVTLREADVSGALLRGADIRDCYFYGADLHGSDLRGTNLSFAILVLSNLAGANLAGANLQGSDLSQANLAGANLQGANLKDATGLTESQLNQAKSASGATMPDGSTHP